MSWWEREAFNRYIIGLVVCFTILFTVMWITNSIDYSHCLDEVSGFKLAERVEIHEGCKEVR